MCQLRVPILPVGILPVAIPPVELMPVELLPIESVTDQDMFFGGIGFPKNHGVKNAISRVPFGIFSTLISVTFFWVQLDDNCGILRSREVGLHKVPLVF